MTIHLYRDLPGLIQALGSDWFCNTLSGVLQQYFQYDFFLFALYQKDRPVKVLFSNFENSAMHQALLLFEAQTHQADPIYRLVQQEAAHQGLFDMTTLNQLSSEFPVLNPEILQLIKVDTEEELGWRTEGWPAYQKETCILTSLPRQQFSAISLYNCGLSEQRKPTSKNTLKTLLPTLHAIISQHFSFTQNLPQGTAVNHSFTKKEISPEKVKDFFLDYHQVTLTKQESVIFSQLFRGNTLAVIANELHISIYTARTHRRNVYKKLGHGRLLELINQFYTFRLQA